MKALIKKLIEFRDERNWEKHHTPKNLAISISLEAAELLDNFQWQEKAKDSDNVKEEMADILAYLLTLAHTLDIDLEKALYAKIEKNALKYPIDQCELIK